MLHPLNLCDFTPQFLAMSILYALHFPLRGQLFMGFNFQAGAVLTGHEFRSMQFGVWMDGICLCEPMVETGGQDEIEREWLAEC